MQRYVDLFPVWAVLLSAIALLAPGPFAALGWLITPLLGIIMLSMGLSLTGSDFRRVLSRPQVMLVGTVAQFAMMPLLAWGVARGLGLSRELATGVILVGCCPGGTASNVIAYLARADVALSVSLTAVSTCLAAIMTPLLTTFYVGQSAPVPTAALFIGVVKLVLLPVAAGTLVNTFYGERLGRLKRWLPSLSVSAIVLIIAIIAALNRDNVASMGQSVFVAVALHNALGLGAGYLAARAIQADVATRRTLVIEIGMQNSGLGVALAKEYFGIASALPGAIFSIWHNLTGSLLAWHWSRPTPK